MNYQKKLKTIVEGIENGDIEAKINFNITDKISKDNLGDYYEITVTDGQTQSSATKLKKAPLFLFAFFLGMFGAHSFYAGHIGRGIVQLLLTLTFFLFFITAIWVLVEWIEILTNRYKDKQGNVVKEW